MMGKNRPTTLTRKNSKRRSLVSSFFSGSSPFSTPNHSTHDNAKDKDEKQESSSSSTTTTSSWFAASTTDHHHTINTTTTSTFTSFQNNNNNGTENSGKMIQVTPLHVNDRVFIADEHYAWLPAKVLKTEPDRVLVEIDLPSDWDTTTSIPTASSSSSISSKDRKGSKSNLQPSQQQELQTQRRWIKLDDYKDRQLPLQNVGHEARDMAELPHLHEAAILYQTKRRHAAGKPYTRVGDIVIALNPCRWIASLYTTQQRRQYAKSFVWQQVPDTCAESPYEEKKEDGATSSSPNRAATTTTSASSTSFTSIYDRLGFEPHVYEVSAMAYRGLLLEQRDQTILVSGESGAGKTETVKIVLQHLATLETLSVTSSCPADQEETSVAPTRGEAHHDSHTNSLVRQIVESSPVFEAFGNAQTLRNHNSSRFGRMTRLHFGNNTCNGMVGLHGSTCQTYLLETSRVVSQAEGERNFHIFYQLMAASNETKRDLLGGGEAWVDTAVSDFLCLNEPSISASKKHRGRGQRGASKNTDQAQLAETLRALEFFQWKGAKLQTLLRALGIVLRLGNIVFVPSSSEEEEGCAVLKRDDLHLAAAALGLPANLLEQAMTKQVIATARDRVEVPLAADAAKDALDALVKKIYASVFDSIVAKINDQTHDLHFAESDAIISVLDIYGFESFDINRFEQLCINYANEKLHKKYVDDNFQRFKVEYEREGIELFDFNKVDNSDILCVFEGRSGLLNAINEECIRRNGSSENFVQKLKKAHRSNSCFIDEKLFGKTQFGVSHFAGPVIYEAEHFVERNTDKLPETLLAAVAQTSNGLVQEALKEIIEQGERRAAEFFKKSNNNKTVLEKFRVQLKELVAGIDETQTRYIRCIKPNDQLSSATIDHQTVMRQLKCAGLVAAIDLSRESYPNKLPFRIAEERFHCLLTQKQASQAEALGELDPRDSASYLMSVLFAPLLEVYRNCDFTLPYAIGKTRIYFRTGALELLESLRHEYYSERARRIQRWGRSKNAKRTFRSLRNGTTLLQALVRAHLVRLRLRRLGAAASVIQSEWRGFVLRSEYKASISSVFLVQAACRGFAARKLLGERRHAALILSTFVRMYPHRSSFAKQRRAAVAIQKMIRAHAARKRFMGCLWATRVVQLAVRHIQEKTRAKRQMENRKRHQGTQKENPQHTNSVMTSSAQRSTPMTSTSEHSSTPRSSPVMTTQPRSSPPASARSTPRASPVPTSQDRSSPPVSERSTPRASPVTTTQPRSSPLLSSEPRSSPITIVRSQSQPSDRMLERPEPKYLVQLGSGNVGDEAAGSVSSSSSYEGDIGSQDSKLAQEAKMLKDEVDCQRRQVEELHDQIAAVAEEAEEHQRVLEAEFEDRVAAYEDEVLQLKAAIAEHQAEKKKLREELAHGQKAYLKSVQKLKKSVRRTQESHKEYLLQVTTVLEEANEARKAETAKIMSQLEEVKQSKLVLEQQFLEQQHQQRQMVPVAVAPPPVPQIDAVPSSDHVDPAPTVRPRAPPYPTSLMRGRGGLIAGSGAAGMVLGDSALGGMEEVEHLRRELLAILAPRNLLELVEKANKRPWVRDTHVSKVSDAARERIARLADLAVVAVPRDVVADGSAHQSRHDPCNQEDDQHGANSNSNKDTPPSPTSTIFEV